ncbi:hypothetical protein [Wolbachia endosymbiont of Cruorifilaria tuberocauda]|nr:hypothetical protein [Wolbachia endosymbiont of Cruorifilaria tuberocauda]
MSKKALLELENGLKVELPILSATMGPLDKDKSTLFIKALDKNIYSSR